MVLITPVSKSFTSIVVGRTLPSVPTTSVGVSVILIASKVSPWRNVNSEFELPLLVYFTYKISIYIML